MRIMLINPPDRIDGKKTVSITYFPRGPLIVASFLKMSGADVRILDLPMTGKGYSSIETEIDDFTPDLVGISIHAPSFIPMASRCASAVRLALPDVPVIGGGLFPTIAPSAVLKAIPQMDYILVGDVEDFVFKSFNDILLLKNPSSIPGLAFRYDDEIQVNSPPLIDGKNEISYPIPFYDFLLMELYQEAYKQGWFDPHIETMRGCPFQCSFCAAKHAGNYKGRWDAPVRFRPVSEALDEIEFLVEEYKFRRFFICDEIFTLKKDRVKEFCEGLKERKLDISWRVITRGDFVDETTIQLMARSGCYEIGVGIEVASDRVLESVNKKTTVREDERALDIIENAGIRATAFIIIGLPESTHEDIKSTIAFLSKRRNTIPQVFLFHPAPGSTLGNEFLSEIQQKLDDDPDLWAFFDYAKEPFDGGYYLSWEDVIRYFMLINHIIPTHIDGQRRTALVERFLNNNFPAKKPNVIFPYGEDGRSCYIVPQNGQKSQGSGQLIHLSDLEWEVLLVCRGDYTIEEIEWRIEHLFNLTKKESKFKLDEIIRFFSEEEIIFQNLKDLLSHKSENGYSLYFNVSEKMEMLSHKEFGFLFSFQKTPNIITLNLGEYALCCILPNPSFHLYNNVYILSSLEHEIILRFNKHVNFLNAKRGVNQLKKIFGTPSDQHILSTLYRLDFLLTQNNEQIVLQHYLGSNVLKKYFQAKANF